MQILGMLMRFIVSEERSLAPVLVVAGLIVEIVAIFRKTEKKEENLISGE